MDPWNVYMYVCMYVCSGNQEIEIGAGYTGSSFGVVVGCAMPNVIKIGPLEMGQATDI
jgi:hypothetical protein